MKKFRRTTLLTWGCISVLEGLGLSRKLYFVYGEWAVLFLPALLLLKTKNKTALLIVCFIGLSIGLSRGSLYMAKLNDIKSLSSRQVTVELTAKSDSVYGNKTQLEFTASNAYLTKPYRQELTGNFKISGFGIPMVYRGDRVLVSGKIYPTRGANQAQISYAKLEVVSSGNDSAGKLSRTFSTGIENALPEPQASFGLGILIGQRTNLPADIIQKLTMVGLIHIVAVSGYNLTILIRGMQRLSLKSKYQRTVLSLLVVALFVLITGFSASIVRAAVISALSLWAAFYGRQFKPLLLIFLTAALTGWLNPFYVWSDLGWYLSFLAFFGVLIIAPMLIKRFFKKQPKLLTTVLIETLCAELMTLPLIMAVFGQMSLIGLLANLLVAPLIPAAMLLSAVAALGGMISPLIAGWLAWPAAILLTYMLDVVRLLASIPAIFLHVSVDTVTMIGFYIILGIIVLTMYRKGRIKNIAMAETNLLKTGAD
jgi:competence protein ComEC